MAIDPFYGSLVSSGASLLGGVFANRSSAKAARRAAEQEAYQAELQRTWSSGENELNRLFESGQADRQMQFQETANAKQMAFQERMANTAHQREVEDLRSAGLNPILSGTGGMGSATPAGSTSSGAMGHGSSSGGASAKGFKADVVDVIGPAVSSAVSAALASSQISKQEAETADIRSSTWYRNNSLVGLTDAQIELAKAKSAESSDSAALMREQAKLPTEQVRELASRVLLQVAQSRQAKSLAAESDERTRGLELDRFLRKQVEALTEADMPKGLEGHSRAAKNVLLWFLRGKD